MERLKENEVCENRLCTVCMLDPVTGQVNKGTEFRFYSCNNCHWDAKDSLAGQQLRLWLGSAAPQAGQHLLLFHSLPAQRGTVVRGTSVGDPGKTWPPVPSPHSTSLALTSPPPCFSPENILCCGKFCMQKMWGWGQAQGVPFGAALCTPFPLLPRACTGWEQCLPCTHTPRKDRQGSSCRQAQQPAERVR